MSLFAGLVLTLALGCGGGGGGSTTSQSVTLTLASPTSLSESYMQGSILSSRELSVHASGNMSSLAGVPLYVSVVDPDKIFMASGTTGLTFTGSTTTGQFSATLPGPSFNTAGHFKGNVSVTVATDPQMTHPLAGTPLTIPYDVTVYQALAVDTTPLQLTSTFGDPTFEKTINVTLPAGLTTWNAQTSSSSPGAMFSYPPQVTTQASGALQLSIPPTSPGTYNFTIDISASYSDPGVNQGTFFAQVPVTYTVLPNSAIDYVITPSTISLSTAYGSPSGIPFGSPLLTPNTGVTFDLGTPTLTYLTSPDGATGNPLYNQWIFIQSPSTFFAYASSSTGSTVNPLPAGIYTVELGYSYTKDGGTYHVAVPVTLTIH